MAILHDLQNHCAIMKAETERQEQEKKALTEKMDTVFFRQTPQGAFEIEN